MLPLSTVPVRIRKRPGLGSRVRLCDIAGDLQYAIRSRTVAWPAYHIRRIRYCVLARLSHPASTPRHFLRSLLAPRWHHGMNPE